MAVVLETLGDTERARRPPHRLSATEVEILTMIGQAKSIPVIASTRGISHKTVKAHMSNVFQRIGVTDRTQAALWAQRNMAA